tara:strand:+ start:1534 stop:3414 length:1881 start_codon:yes stop_codon:yes gene_type:complete
VSFSNEEIQRAWVNNTLTHEDYEQGLTRERNDRARHVTIKRAVDNLYRACSGQLDSGKFGPDNDCSPRKKGSGKKPEGKSSGAKTQSKKIPKGKGAERSGVKYMTKKHKLEGLKDGEPVRVRKVMDKLSDENALLGELEYTPMPKKAEGQAAKDAAIAKNDLASDLISDATTDEIMHVHEQGLLAQARGERKKSGEGWYAEQMDGAMAIMYERYPDMKGNAEHNFAFKSILAITSHNQDVMKNFEIADHLYQKFRDACAEGDCEFSTDFRDGGQANAPMRGKMELLNHMHNKWGHEATHEFLMKEMPVKKINAFMKQKEVPEEVWDSVGGELQTYNVAGSVVFGPKLGSFYNNLNGNFDSVTMDLWFTRTMTRIGGVATKQDLKGIQKTAKSMLETIDWASVEGEGYLYPEGLDWGNHGVPSKAKAKVIAATPKLKDKPVTGDAAHDHYKRIFQEGQYQPEIVKGWLQEAVDDPASAEENEQFVGWLKQQKLAYGASRTYVVDKQGNPSYGKQEYYKDGSPKPLKQKRSTFKDKTKLNKEAKNLFLKLNPKKDAPSSGAERNWYREVMEKTKEKLEARGVKMTYADMQAVLWYNEKQLMGQFGFTGKGSETNDYLDAAKALKPRKK